ncbi:MAG: hypothetical protein F7C07_02505 [Desulfurococcales archaeon]|nr:hypothetical protein [Desulfurococcales archaeon]
MDRQKILELSAIIVSLTAAILGFYVFRSTGLQRYAFISVLWLTWAVYLSYSMARRTSKGNRKRV